MWGTLSTHWVPGLLPADHRPPWRRRPRLRSSYPRGAGTPACGHSPKWRARVPAPQRNRPMESAATTAPAVAAFARQRPFLSGRSAIGRYKGRPSLFSIRPSQFAILNSHCFPISQSAMSSAPAFSSFIDICIMNAIHWPHQWRLGCDPRLLPT